VDEPIGAASLRADYGKTVEIGTGLNKEIKMSQFMQIDIRVIPFFEVPFEKRFPRLVELLRRLNYGEVLKKEPSFYELIDTMATILDHPESPSEVKDLIGPYVTELEKLKDLAREHLLGRRLDELDQMLYRIEDQFEDLEGAL
jgi:hypothetical protein